MLNLKEIKYNTSLFKNLLFRRKKNDAFYDLIILLKKKKQLLSYFEKKKIKLSSLEKQIDIKPLFKKLKIIKNNLIFINKTINKILYNIPNIPEKSIPYGVSSTENLPIYVKKLSNKKNYKLFSHLNIGQHSKNIDFTQATNISGHNFSLFRGSISRLNSILILFFLDYHLFKGDREISVPFIVKEKSLLNTGQLPKFYNDLFKMTQDVYDLFLIPTAEVPLTNLYSNTLINNTELPIRLFAYSPCFRKETGSAGLASTGLIRLHQFEKVELVRFSKESQTNTELNLMVLRVEELLFSLNIPYRLLLLCTGDLGFTSKKTIDIESWLPSQKKYLEISSCSILGSFQTRRANIRTNIGKKKILVHSLNGSALPIGRTILSLLENNQSIDSSINVPKILWGYFHGQKHLHY